VGKIKEFKTLIKNIDGKGNDLIEIRKYDPKTERLDIIITVTGYKSHYHGWSDPANVSAGGVITYDQLKKKK
jgi:hypothetical protein